MSFMKNAYLTTGLLLLIALSGELLGSNEANEKWVKELSCLIKKGSEERLSEGERERASSLFLKLLAGDKIIGEGAEWTIRYDDPYGETYEGAYEDDEVRHPSGFIIYLIPSDGSEANPYLRGRIFYHSEPPEGFGNEYFEGFPSIGLRGDHRHVLVGNIEIQVGARSDDYRREERIHEILKGFELEVIKEL